MVFSFFKKQTEQKPVPEPKKPVEQASSRAPVRPQAAEPVAKSVSPAAEKVRVSQKPAPVVPRLAAAAQAALPEEIKTSARPSLATPNQTMPAQKAGQAVSAVSAKTAPAVTPPVQSFSSRKEPARPPVAQAKPHSASVMTPPSAPAMPPDLPAKGAPSSASSDFDLDDDLTLTESFVMNADADSDPVQADVEQVVIMYADGRDSAARVQLEKLLPAYSPAEGRKLWLLLFDLLQVQGDRAGFDRLCLEFARVCEMSPPSWRDDQPKKKTVARSGSIVLSGVLTSDDPRLLRQIQEGLAKPGDLILDCARWMGCDDVLAGQMAEMLQTARRGGKSVFLSGIEAFMQRLDARLEVGVPEHEPSWRLLLELLQRYATQDRFEERAVDYAISFELSPPSWEPREDRASPLLAAADGLALDDFFPDESEGAHCLSGSLVNHRFDDIQPYLVAHNPAILDFSAVSRVDFFSAGQLVNRLAPLAAQGRQITIQHPNRLVCGLLQIVGLDQFARIVTAKA